MFNDINIMPNVSNTGYTNLQESALFFSTTQMKGEGNVPIPVIQEYYGAYGGNKEGGEQRSSFGGGERKPFNREGGNGGGGERRSFDKPTGDRSFSGNREGAERRNRYSK